MKLLALSPGGRLHRDRVVDALWPDLTLDVALPRLHKAAHYARGALDDRDAVVLEGEVVALFPLATLEVDATAFEMAADSALAAEPVSPEECASALKLAGELLPDDLAEVWLEGQTPTSSSLRGCGSRPTGSSLRVNTGCVSPRLRCTQAAETGTEPLPTCVHC